MQRILLIKMALIGVVTLILQIPVSMIRGLVTERQQNRDAVLADIARGTSESQKISGPVLYIPWSRRIVETASAGGEANGRNRQERVETGHFALLPETLKLTGKVDLQPKHRGLYTSHVYRLDAVLLGSFVLPQGLGIQAGRGKIEWGEPRLVLGVQDTRGIRGEGLRLDWNGAPLELRPGGSDAAGIPSGVHALTGALPEGQASVEFRIAMTVIGTERLEILPVGKRSDVALESNWPHPSFTGRILPEAGAKITTEGFSARWQATHLATNLGQLYQRCVDTRQCDAFRQHTVGVSFIQPVDLYQTVERAVKYGFLFLLITFASFFLFEVLKGVPIHPVQYALVGVALAIFFLLLISLSEHLGFAAAYALATAACVSLLGYYVSFVLHSRRRGGVFALGLGSLYGLLFVLLRLEDHALMLGSMLVFACLAFAMFATRKVDWYAAGNTTPGDAGAWGRKPA